MLRTIAKILFAGKPGFQVPQGQRYYVIGDIHGRADLLRDMRAMVLADDDVAAYDTAATVVFLGDYVDRGEESKQVVEFLCRHPFHGFHHIFLLGNHEQALLDFLDDPAVGRNWFNFGGETTLESYGAIRRGEFPQPGNYVAISAKLRQQVPAHHLKFLQNLELSHVAGDYLFVHAGIQPGVSLENQHRDDLIWIREAFLQSRLDHGKMVIHGHSIKSKPEIRKNRIGIDTGAYASNILTCLVLEGAQRRFLQTQ